MDLFARVFFNIIVILLCGGIVYILLFYLRKNSAPKGNRLKIIDRLSLDNRHALVLIRFKEKELLLSLSPAGVVVIDICTLSDGEGRSEVKGT